MIKIFDEKKAMKIDRDFQKIVTDYIKNNNKCNCLYGDCINEAVNSHAISKKSSLKYITNDKNKVISFVKGKLFLDEDGNLSVTPKKEPFGINESTTFCGFCTEHEALFKRIDLNGLKTINDLIMQIYRSVAYAYYKEKFIEKEQDFHESILKDNREKILETIKAEYSIEINLDELLDDVLKNINEKKFRRMNILRELMDKLELLISRLDIQSRTLSNDEIFELNEIEIVVFFKRMDIKIPLAMLNDFGYIYEDKNISNCFFNVIPYENSTDIIMFVDKKSKSNAMKYWQYNTQDDIYILNMVEDMMIKSEYWFVEPSIFESMDDRKQSFIEADIRYSISERALKFGYDVSIFDSLRKKILKNYENVSMHEKYINIIHRELEKIYNLPKREKKEIREKNLMKYIEERY